MKNLVITNQITPQDFINRYLREIRKIRILNTEEEDDLIKRIRKGDRSAFEILVRSNLRFVVSVAKQYQGLGLDMLDLINEGNMGLIKAAEMFDETRYLKFITYALWWIRRSILQALNEQSGITSHKTFLKKY